MKKLGVILLVLSLILSYNPQAVFAAETTSIDQELTDYLSEVSTIRGFEVTDADLDESLATFGLAKDDFATLDEMKEVLGDVIKADLSNLDTIYEYYELDQASLTQLLSEYGEDLNDYIFINDLDMDLYFYTGAAEQDSAETGSGAFPTFDKTMLLDMISEIGLSEDELTKVQEHYVTIMEDLESAEVQSQLEDLNTRMMVIAESINSKVTADPNYKPTQTEMNELSAIYEEMLSVYQLDLGISIVKDGVVTPITLAELMLLSDIEGADLLIKIYNADGQLLADAEIPNELIEEQLGDIIGNIGDSSNDDGTVETVKGGQLPKTAANYIPNALIGMLIALAGILVLRKVRTNKGEALNQ